MGTCTLSMYITGPRMYASRLLPMAATSKEEKATAPLLPAVQPAPLCTNAPAVQSVVQLNQVAARQQLDAPGNHVRA